MNGAEANLSRSCAGARQLYMQILVSALALALLGFILESITAPTNSPRSSSGGGVGGTGFEATKPMPAADAANMPVDGKWTRLDLRCNECGEGEARLPRQEAPFAIRPAFYETISGKY
jgi:hypothetical protein